ncbi:MULTISPECIES: SDR family NAD(P)-dependent oxidoreductase [Vibrio]|uniref:SDR family NAD(P)-dependent oxidoreductase n=1 Tax=Vibrio TaxID=662 RepID=UPI00089323B9|nr:MULTISPECIES: SDR family NAD(P)-dependent oxidoreductase [Vibrio]OFJ21736.1 hypothetical protein BFX31_12710 [Vibrio paracholerae]TXX52485.1 SDR family NAD(P)-dependent oxidoreductase [Vibrio cholerae]WOR00783.1 SDR family NAD(P)-dependent oxidoreductase [Vibrio paracholerae]
MHQSSSVVIAGYGPALGEALAERFHIGGYQVIPVSRRGAWATDLKDPEATAALFSRIDSEAAPLAGVIHNAMEFHRQAFLATSSDTFLSVWQSMVLTAVNVSQHAIPRLTARGGGSLLFSGASGSVRAGAEFSAFSSAKFALRGLAQSLAREHEADGIHVAHVVVDGLIRSERTAQRFAPPATATLIEPADLAEQYFWLFQQSRSGWTHEIDVRPAQAAR